MSVARFRPYGVSRSGKLAAMTFEGHSDDGSLLRASLTELTELLVAEESIDTVLNRVVALACSGIGECDFASVTAMIGSEPGTVVFTDPIAREIDEAQYKHDAGPCLAAMRRRQIVSIPSMADGDSWQPVRAAALARGVRSSLSLPLATGNVEIGALNLYGRTDQAFSSVPSDDTILFAAQAAAALWGAKTHAQTRNMIENLEAAIVTRDLIGMAKGIVMANEKATPNDAFALLRAASQRRNIKLRDLAIEVTSTGATPQ